MNNPDSATQNESPIDMAFQAPIILPDPDVSEPASTSIDDARHGRNIIRIPAQPDKNIIKIPSKLLQDLSIKDKESGTKKQPNMDRISRLAISKNITPKRKGKDRALLSVLNNAEEPDEILETISKFYAFTLVQGTLTYDEAKKHPNWAKVQCSRMARKDLDDNETWVLVEPPPGRKIIGSRCIFTDKVNEHGEPVKFKG
jgi:hypothetical protein